MTFCFTINQYHFTINRYFTLKNYNLILKCLVLPWKTGCCYVSILYGAWLSINISVPLFLFQLQTITIFLSHNAWFTGYSSCCCFKPCFSNFWLLWASWAKLKHYLRYFSFHQLLHRNHCNHRGADRSSI